jgi:hypothetical protein
MEVTCNALAMVSASHELHPCQRVTCRPAHYRDSSTTSPLASRKSVSKYDTPPTSNADVAEALAMGIPQVVVHDRNPAARFRTCRGMLTLTKIKVQLAAAKDFI